MTWNAPQRFTYCFRELILLSIDSCFPFMCCTSEIILLTSSGLSFISSCLILDTWGLTPWNCQEVCVGEWYGFVSVLNLQTDVGWGGGWNSGKLLLRVWPSFSLWSHQLARSYKWKCVKTSWSIHLGPRHQVTPARTPLATFFILKHELYHEPDSSMRCKVSPSDFGHTFSPIKVFCLLPSNVF